MGNTSLKGKDYQAASKYGQIFLQSDKQLYHPGETVTGKIHLNIVEPFPGTKLCLKFTGKQRVYFVRKILSGNESINYLEDEAKNFITQIADVHTWTNEVTVGQYTIPFSFLLPPSLPTSFNQSGKGFRAHIIYKMEAFLQPTIEALPKLKHKQPFIIRDSLPLEEPQSILKDEAYPVFGGCLGCYKKGAISIKVNFDKNIYAPGDILKADSEVDNTLNQLKCDRIVLSLTQKITLNVKGGAPWNHWIQIKQQEFLGMQAGAPVEKLSVEFAIPLPNQTLTNVTKTAPLKLDLIFQEDDKKSLGYVCSSDDISSVYLLEVECFMDSDPLNKIRAEHPINILYPEPEADPEHEDEEAIAPKDWKPQVMDTCVVSFSYPPPFGASFNSSNIVKNSMVGSRSMIGSRILNPNADPNTTRNSLISPRAILPI